MINENTNFFSTHQVCGKYCRRSGYLCVGEIYTSYVLSLKLRKIPLHASTENSNFRVVSPATTYLIPMLIFALKKNMFTLPA